MKYLTNDGIPVRCVSCGQPIELAPSGLPNHHCSVRHEAGKRSRNVALEEPFMRTPTFGRRLRDGFNMIGEGRD